MSHSDVNNIDQDVCSGIHVGELKKCISEAGVWAEDCWALAEEN